MIDEYLAVKLHIDVFFYLISYKLTCWHCCIRIWLLLFSKMIHSTRKISTRGISQRVFLIFRQCVSLQIFLERENPKIFLFLLSTYMKADKLLSTYQYNSLVMHRVLEETLMPSGSHISMYTGVLYASKWTTNVHAVVRKTCFLQIRKI